MRSVGIDPSELELQDMLFQGDLNGTGKILFPDYLTLMAPKFKGSDDDDQALFDAFLQFDKNSTGMIDIRDLKQRLTNQGDKLPEAEVEFLFKEAGLSDVTMLDYKEYVKTMKGEIDKE